MFKEHNYGQRRWYVEIPSTGMANLLPHFTFDKNFKGDDLERLPASKDIETFISKIMQPMRLSNEVCLMSLIFIDKLLKVGNV